MISKKSISLLIASLFFLGFHSFSLAQEPDLFEIEIDADMRDLRSNIRIQKQAIEKLIVRLTNPEKSDVKKITEQFFPEPAKYIKQFRLSDNRNVLVSLDGDSIQEVLIEAGVSLWRIDRPTIMIFLAIESAMGEREIVVSDYGHRVFSYSTGIDKNLNIKDLTGAGDLFASGFLHGFVNNLSLRESLKKGTELSSKIIQKVGARI